MKALSLSGDLRVPAAPAFGGGVTRDGINPRIEPPASTPDGRGYDPERS
jgi:hypothetical protein